MLKNTLQLSQLNLNTLPLGFNVELERTIQELKGTSASYALEKSRINYKYFPQEA